MLNLKGVAVGKSAIAYRVFRGNQKKKACTDMLNLKGVAVGNGLTDPKLQYQVSYKYSKIKLENWILRDHNLTMFVLLLDFAQYYPKWPSKTHRILRLFQRKATTNALILLINVTKHHNLKQTVCAKKLIISVRETFRNIRRFLHLDSTKEVS